MSAARGRSAASRWRVEEPPATGAAAQDAEPDQEQVARAIALRMLTDSPRSRAQLEQAMARKAVPDEVAAAVLDRFTEVGLVDDAQYAELVVRSRHAERGLSSRALRAELRRRGVDDEVSQEALAQLTPEQEEATARRLVARKLASTAGLDTPVRIRRTLAALGRKGYPPGLVARLVREELSSAQILDEAGLLDEAGPLDG
ncbi:MAG: recombination regulator RecX [Actinobacteria bacterium]|nr:recombination regulator RecX [Actinomycetota bacterium]